MKACTIAARNYLAQVEILAASFKAHHPHGEFDVLVIDESPAACKGSDLYNVVGLHEIGLPQEEIWRMAMMYDVTEFSTAVKPWFLRHLLATGAGEVIYLDPDIEIFASLDDIFELARMHGIVLTPHSTTPFPRDDRKLDETDILGAGIYNLGFIGLGPGSGDFLDWWSERLRRECVSDPSRMRFTDQRWVDFVPSLFKHHILKDEACNVAYWNLHSRKVTWAGAGYEVNGIPLRFFHFSGFDPDEPHILSKHAGQRPRVLLSEEPGVARLCRHYAGKLIEAGFSSRNKTGYGYDTLDNGFRITPPVRLLYREAQIASETTAGKVAPPIPFAPGGTEAFMAWLNEPATQGCPEYTRYLQSLYMFRPDVREAFPDPAVGNARDFINWVFISGRREHDIPEILMPGRQASKVVLEKQAALHAGQPIPEVDVAGYFQAELGVGEAGRLLVSGIEAANIPFNIISLRDTVNRQEHPFRHTGSEDSGAKIKILCMNGDVTPSFARQMGRRFFEGCHTIGVWFWEIEEFPRSMFAGFDHVDEIWVASEFVAQALRKVSTKPVFTFPLPVPKLPAAPSISRADLGLPEGYLFFFSFDFFSVFERKNPIAVVQAFTNAFAPGEGPVLVIKSINGDKNLPALEKLRHAAAGRRDITIIDGYLPHSHKDAMMAHCDCYVSLHRGEGFGLTMAEAMSLAKPAIATRYGGNVDFMTDKNSYLCPYRLRAIGDGSAPYPPRAEWAEPDNAAAAALMRHVFEHRTEAATRGKLAARDIESRQSAASCARFVRERMAWIHANRFADRGGASSFAKQPGKKKTGELESKTQEVFDQLQENIKDLSDMEKEMDAMARELINTAKPWPGNSEI